MSNIKIIEHPFKEAVRMMLSESFSPSIVSSFYLSFEAEHISIADSLNIFNQVKSGNLIMEVRYKNPDGTFEYICDLYSWQHPAIVKAKLLRFITDKYKTGKIKGWLEEKGKISKAIDLGIYETPDHLIADAMVKPVVTGPGPDGIGKKGELPN